MAVCFIRFSLYPPFYLADRFDTSHTRFDIDAYNEGCKGDDNNDNLFKKLVGDREVFCERDANDNG